MYKILTRNGLHILAQINVHVNVAIRNVFEEVSGKFYTCVGAVNVLLSSCGCI